jgi:hypothetical protein
MITSTIYMIILQVNVHEECQQILVRHVGNICEVTFKITNNIRVGSHFLKGLTQSFP